MRALLFLEPLMLALLFFRTLDIGSLLSVRRDHEQAKITSAITIHSITVSAITIHSVTVSAMTIQAITVSAITTWAMTI